MVGGVCISDRYIGGCATIVGGGIADGSCEAIGADAAALLVDNNACSTVSASIAGLAVGKAWPVVLVLFWQNDQGDRYYDRRRN